MHVVRLHCTLFSDVVTDCSLDIGGGEGAHKKNPLGLWWFVNWVSLCLDVIKGPESFDR
jgi:hypothetical protein